MKTAIKVVKVITEVFNIIAICALVFLLLLVFFSTLLRYVFNSPIPGTFELARMSMICLSPSMAAAVIHKKSIWVDVFVNRFNRVGQFIIDVLTIPLAGIVWGFIAYSAYGHIFRSISNNTHFTSIKLYEWPFRVVFFVGMAVTTLSIFAFTAERLSQYKGGGMPHDESEVEQAVKKAAQMDFDDGGEMA